MKLFVTGLNHRSAPVELRERFSLSPGANLGPLIPKLQENGDLSEVVVLSTCNRTEIYGIARSMAPCPERLFEEIARVARHEEASRNISFMDGNLYYEESEPCIRHIFRVASGLDSMVLGETEILGQVKQAYQTAHAHRGTGKTLNKLFQKTFSVAKEVRTRFGIGRRPTSVGSVAVNLAAQIFGDDLARRTALIIGAGKIGETTLKHLAKQGIGSILVANRSPERAVELAGRFGGRSVPFSSVSEILRQADIVISSTGAPHPILFKKDVADAMEQRGGRPLFLIDLAVPRDIEPAAGELEGAYIFNIDQLAEVAQQNMARREAEVVPCEKLIAAHAAKFASWLALQGQVSHAASTVQERPSFVPFQTGFAEPSFLV